MVRAPPLVLLVAANELLAYLMPASGSALGYALIGQSFRRMLPLSRLSLFTLTGLQCKTAYLFGLRARVSLTQKINVCSRPNPAVPHRRIRRLHSNQPAEHVHQARQQRRVEGGREGRWQGRDQRGVLRPRQHLRLCVADGVGPRLAVVLRARCPCTLGPVDPPRHEHPATLERYAHPRALALVSLRTESKKNCLQVGRSSSAECSCWRRARFSRSWTSRCFMWMSTSILSSCCARRTRSASATRCG